MLKWLEDYMATDMSGVRFTGIFILVMFIILILSYFGG